MAVIGNSATTQAFTPAVDYFSGNGSTTAFTLSRPVASVAQVQVVIDNVAQNPSSAYTISGSTITFTSAPLSGTNNIYVYYTSPITQVIAPGQGTVSSTSFASSTGSGAVVLATSPTLVTPALGTPSALVLTNATGLPQAGLGTNVVGNGPAFSAYKSSNQSFSQNTWTKATFPFEDFDTNNNFDSTTNYRFTPTVAGYYHMSCNGYFSNGGSDNYLQLYKNGAGFGYYVNAGFSITTMHLTFSNLIYMNGSTDYLELWVYSNAASPVLGGSATHFQGVLVRSA